MKPAAVCRSSTPSPLRQAAMPMVSLRQPRSARNLARNGITTPVTSARKKLAAFRPTRLDRETVEIGSVADIDQAPLLGAVIGRASCSPLPAGGERGRG